MPTYIYPSEKVLPYVYYGVHKITNQFYFGVRYGKCYLTKKLPSHIDLYQYQTSSTNIKELGFENFNWYILAEFFEPEDAISFEKECIKLFWKHPLSLNFRLHDKNIIHSGPFSEEHKANLRKAAKTRPPVSDKTRAKHKLRGKGKDHHNYGKNPYANKTPEEMLEISIKKSNARKGVPTAENAKHFGVNTRANKTPEEIQLLNEKISKAQKGIPKGHQPKVMCPHCLKEGGKSLMKRYHFDNCKS